MKSSDDNNLPSKKHFASEPPRYRDSISAAKTEMDALLDDILEELRIASPMAAKYTPVETLQYLKKKCETRWGVEIVRKVHKEIIAGAFNGPSNPTLSIFTSRCEEMWKTNQNVQKTNEMNQNISKVKRSKSMGGELIKLKQALTEVRNGNK